LNPITREEVGLVNAAIEKPSQEKNEMGPLPMNSPYNNKREDQTRNWTKGLNQDVDS
jgi:hypothetical protein